MSYGVSGANARASGIDLDLRRDEDIALAWKHVDWKVWTHPDGDSFARYRDAPLRKIDLRRNAGEMVADEK